MRLNKRIAAAVLLSLGFVSASLAWTTYPKETRDLRPDEMKAVQDLLRLVGKKTPLDMATLRSVAYRAAGPSGMPRWQKPQPWMLWAHVEAQPVLSGGGVCRKHVYRIKRDDDSGRLRIEDSGRSIAWLGKGDSCSGPKDAIAIDTAIDDLLFKRLVRDQDALLRKASLVIRAHSSCYSSCTDLQLHAAGRESPPRVEDPAIVLTYQLKQPADHKAACFAGPLFLLYAPGSIREKDPNLLGVDCSPE